ncbi:MAG: hypothetical protein M3Z16_03855, partial [Pseudomonadota bacterium]|nr:hypothetical protein [Pseudomonadota bacterium]
AQPALPPPIPVAVAPVLPLHVIGTYEDGGALTVFVASPNGTLVARLGSVLIGDYQVTGLTHQQLALLQLSTQRSIELPIPAAGQR